MTQERIEDDNGQTSAEIIAEANELARGFYALRGYEVPEGYRFDQATHPHERECWAMAELAYGNLCGTELSEILNELDDD